MAENTSVLAPSRIREEELQRAEEFALEPFVHEGEDADVVLAEGTPRRHALDDALAEIESGRTEPSIEWQRKYSLMLGLERLLAEEEPHLADGTVLSAHQVDALSGTLTALLAEAQRGANGNGNGRGNGNRSTADASAQRVSTPPPERTERRGNGAASVGALD